MKLKVKFDFHNVGQGLFYTGKINDFNFVYDCGSQAQKITKEPIDTYKKDNLKNNTIDLLVISHFDEDHINGLDYLLKDVEVEYAIIPYCCPRETLILALKNANSPRIYFDFLVDPVTFLFERGVKKILLVTGSKYRDYKYSAEFNIDGRDFEKYYKYITENKLEIVTEIESINETLKKAYSKEDKQFFNYWYFKLYYHEMELDTLDVFEECLDYRDIFFDDGESLQKHIRDPDSRKKIKGCYKKAINGNKLNLTSLAMYHGPIGLYTKREFVISSSNLSLSGFHSIFQKDKEERIGHLLTGDINFKINYKELIDYFIEEVDQTAVIQIPHHGSLRSWNNAILYDFKGCNFWVASSGFSSQYSHPHLDVISDIFNERRLFGWCHEFSKVTIDGELIPK